MKYLYIILLILITSCKQENKDKLKTNIVANDTIEAVKKTVIEEDKSKEFNLLDAVFENLDIKRENCKTNLITSQINSNNPKETIIIIPEIADEGEHYFDLNSHIVIVDNETGNIIYKYFESSQTNGWTSDAIQLRLIKIDTASYIVNDNTSAFGVKVYFLGASRVNPYVNETLTLFKKSEHGLTKILDNFDVTNQTGRWDINCDSEFTDITSMLMMSKEKVNNHFNIIVKNNSTKSITFLNENGDCDSKDTKTSSTLILKFDGEMYH